MKLAGRLGIAVLLAMSAALLAWTAVSPAQAPGPVIVVGDSLEVGTGPHLKRELRGVEVTVDARSGRRSSEGVDVLRERIRAAHRVVVFDLGTNDDPSQPARLRRSLAAARDLAGERCLVVSTLVRPSPGGVRAGAANDVIERFGAAASTVRVADWRAAASRAPELIGSDGVHATREGYAARARLLADAVRSCAEPPRAAAPSSRAGTPDRGTSAAMETGWAESLERLTLPVELPLAALRRAGQLVEAALQQAEGSLVPILPDPPLGRPGDPLGKRSP